MRSCERIFSLFTDSDDAMAIADDALRGAANDIHATATSLTTTPDFHRYALSRGNETVRVDLVRDRAAQLRPKTVVDGVRMDTTEEIFANKIAALVGRSELRDIVDLMALEKLGLRVEDFLGDARKKDAGVSAATLAWLLSTTRAADRVNGASREDLEAFIRALDSNPVIETRPQNTLTVPASLASVQAPAVGLPPVRRMSPASGS